MRIGWLAHVGVLGVFAAASFGGEVETKKVAVIDGLQTPESVAIDADSGVGYISNVVTSGGSGPWADDGTGFLSRLTSPAKLEAKKWRASEPDRRLHGPKGLCLHDGAVWAADNTRVVKFDRKGEKRKVYKIDGAKRLNDMATGRNAVWVSDFGTSKIHRIGDDGSVKTVPGPPVVNGITLHDGTLYAVSWKKHDVYRVDTESGSLEPFGLAKHFKSLDGIELLPNGVILVSDFKGGKVAAISPDHERVETLVKLKTAADIGVDRKRNLLYVPSLTGGRVEVYKLK